MFCSCMTSDKQSWTCNSETTRKKTPKQLRTTPKEFRIRNNQKKKLRPFADFCARFADFLRPFAFLIFSEMSQNCPKLSESTPTCTPNWCPKVSESTPNFTPNWCPKVSEIKGRYIFMYVLPWQMNTQPPGQDLPLLLHEILHEIHTWYKTMTPEYTWICFATDSWKLRTALRHTMYHSVEAGRTTLGPKHLLQYVAFSCMGKIAIYIYRIESI